MQHKKVILLVMTLLCISLIGLQAQSVKDFDGNVYKTVIIGKQVWMTENLKTTKYNDGSSIPLVKNTNEWKVLTTPAYCWYNNDEKENKNKFGALYNWYTVGTDKLCPKGWHVPTNLEWNILISYLGGENVAGGKLKEKGTTHWESPNTGATNISGFNALPGSSRNFAGEFGFTGSNTLYYRSNGCWWSSSGLYDFNAYYIRLYNALSEVYNSLSTKQSGYSVRCVKD